MIHFSRQNRLGRLALTLSAVAWFVCGSLVLTTSAQRIDGTATASITAPSPAQRAQPGAALSASSIKTSITGRLLGEGGDPLPGVSVVAQPRSTFGGNFIQSQSVSTPTDEQGAFRIDNLNPGLYSIFAPVRGYIPDPSDTPPGSMSPVYRAGDNVTIRLVRGGVLTGTVTDTNGEPVVAISVRALYVRDIEGVVSPVSFGSEDQTDDRGVFRIFGLRQGIYVVVANNDTRFGGPLAVSPYDNETPTFYPSGTRDTALEITVRAGQETAGIDIRYRAERGRRVTGTISAGKGQIVPEAGATVNLTYSNASSMPAAVAFAPPSRTASGATSFTDRSFSLEGVADGEYEIRASVTDREFNTSVSPPTRVTVSGSDVTGLRLLVAPYGAITGNVLLEPLAEVQRSLEACKSVTATLAPQETLIGISRDEVPTATTRASGRISPRREAAPDQAGAFVLRNLEAGKYRLDARAVDENWYLRAIQLPGAAPAVRQVTRAAAARNASPQREGIELSEGQKLGGVTIRFAEGAAGLSGKIVPAKPSDPLPSAAHTRIQLLPGELEHVDLLVRYYETIPSSDGSFWFKGLAPGKYFVLIREVQPADTAERPAIWDTNTRARLRRQAETTGSSVELPLCGHIKDFSLRIGQPANK